MSYIHYFLIFCLLLAQSQTAFAQEEEYLSSLKGGSITPNANLIGEDAWYNYMQTNTDWEDRSFTAPKEEAYDLAQRFTNISMDSYLSFRWEGSEEAIFTDNWSYRIEVGIQSWNTEGQLMSSSTRWLSIDYKVDRQENFKDWDVFHIPGAARIVIKVLNVEYTDQNGTTATPSQIPLMKEDLYLEAKVKVKRVFSIDLGTDLELVQENLDLGKNTVTYTWDHIEGAEEYDFEWLYISNDIEVPIDPNLDPLVWERATRVSVNHNHYMIELPYDEGEVYFRVRAVAYGNELNHRLISPWTPMVDPYPSVSILISGGDIQPLEMDKNWTYQASYAEQGKRVEVLNFADGTGRARQSVTKDNSYDRSIVSETVFDREGRQAIQVIPSVAPINDNQLKFFEKYNLGYIVDANQPPTLGEPIHWTHFDTDEHYIFDAAQKSMALSAFSGSSRYFSAANSEKNTDKSAFIADAEGYPYTQTVFDNQGRVKLQSGVGKTHRFGSGHESEYYYATAFQEDLDELFGSEIGYAKHYSMQMAKDPNGQLSISYTNLSGQTIATALLGNAPKDENDNTLVEPLDGGVYRYSTEREKTRNLIEFNEPDESEFTSAQVVRKEFMVTSPGDYDFHYEVNTSTFTGCDGVIIPCEFELKINVYDSEGNVLNNELNILSNGSTLVFGEFFDVVDLDVFDFRFTADLNDLKSYTIEKILRLKDISDKVAAHEALLEAANQEYMQDLAAYYEDPDNYSPPTYTQSNCVGVPPLITPDNCGNYNPDPSDLSCEGLRALLITDMLPGGQYYDRLDWLENNASSIVPVTYQSIYYPDWASVRALSYIEIEEFMTNYNVYEYHPEWCLYKYQCVDNPDPITQLTWYQALRTQDVKWLAMDAATADILPNNYLTIPSAGMCEQGTGANAPWYGNLSYSMLTDVKSVLDDYSSYISVPELEDYIKLRMCDLVSDGSTNFDVGELADLANPNISIDQKWTAIRGLMMECKRRGINEHIVNKFASDNSCGFLLDDSPDDGEYVTADGFDIRSPNYTDVIAQTEVATGLNTSSIVPGINNQQTAVHSANQMMGNNTQGQQQTICEDDGYYVWNSNWWSCFDFGMIGTQTEYILDFSDVPTSQQALGLTGPITVAFLGSPDANITGLAYNGGGGVLNPCDLGSIQQEFDLQMQDLPTALQNDINLEVIDLTWGKFKIKVTLPNKPEYQGAKLVNKRKRALNPLLFLFTIPWIHLNDVTVYSQEYGDNCSQVGDFNMPCDFYRIVETIPCGSTNDVALTLQLNSTTIPPPTTTTIPLGTITASMLSNCASQSELTPIQNLLDDAVSGLSNLTLKEDIRLFARLGANGIEIILKLKGWTLLSTGVYEQDRTTYAGAFLIIDNGVGNTETKAIEYFSCDDQDYTTCVCEEIKALTTEYSISLPTVPAHQAIAARYTNDLGFLVYDYDIQFIENNYCSLGTPSVPSYPLSSFQDLQDWKAAFKEEVGINFNLRNELSKCLDIGEPLSCEDEAISLALFHTEEYLKNKTEEALVKYREDLKISCIGNLTEVFDLTYIDRALHYTLYYYDASGSLVQTVPPTGVEILETRAELDAAADRRDDHHVNPSAQTEEPGHDMETTYHYNTLNEVVESEAPDRGVVNTYYDKLGRPVFSQDAQQKVDKTANYISYDALGRVIETGLIKENANPPPGNIPLTFNSILNSIALGGITDLRAEGLVGFSGWTTSEIRTTIYDQGIASLDVRFKNELGLRRNRVGGQTYSMEGGQTIDYQIAYNYDVFGNAKEVWQYYPQLIGNSYKQLEYDYDLISGVVHQVDYQKGEKDQLSFKYAYDANNRLTKAESSINGFIWNTEAQYEYYYHGPLKRMELGDSKVQGMDYLYTMHGWIKGVNSNKLDGQYDPGRDGNSNSTLHTNTGVDINGKVAQDAFGYTVHYYDGDYTAINTGVQDFSEVPVAGETGNLFNGNISSVTQAQTKPAIGADGQVALSSIWKKYRYDQLHRLVKAQTLEKPLGTAWGAFPLSGKFDPPTSLQTEYTYGPNGNILSLKRYEYSPVNIVPFQLNLLDDLSYEYNEGTANIATDPKLFVNNKLSTVKDASTQTFRNDDLKDMVDDNYVYDENGSLIEDKMEYIESIKWTSEQKVRSVTRPSLNPENRPDLEYVYDFQGNRIEKTLIPNISGENEKHTIYVRDPQGNVLGVYEYEKEPGQLVSSIYNTPVVYLKEQMLYGSDRLGMIKRHVQTGGPLKILGDGSAELSTVTPKIMLTSYLEHIESNPFLSYLDFNQVRDEGFNLSNVVGLDDLSFVAKDQLYLKSFPIFEQGDPVMQRMERIRGNYRYELKNFRGDIRQVITDVKSGEDTGVDNIADFYTANVIQVSDGYSFGWDIVERSFTVDDHRYGFNGKENDKDFGSQIIQDYGFRLYNPALAKFLSVDPLAPEYPELTTYQFASNNPIKFIDLDGLEGCTKEAAKRAAEKANKKPDQAVLKTATSAIVKTATRSQKTFDQGVADGVLLTGYNIVRFLERDMWHSSTYEVIDHQIIMFAQIGLYAAYVDFDEKVINGSDYSRGKYLGEVGAGSALGGPTGGLRGVVANVVKKSAGGASKYIRHLAHESRKTTSFGFNPVRSKSGKFTEPTLPPKTVVKENGITLEHYYRTDDHYVGHLHVKDQNHLGKTTIDASGKVIEGTLSSAAKGVIKNNGTWINRSVKKINKWLKYHNPSTIKGVKKPPLKDQ